MILTPYVIRDTSHSQRAVGGRPPRYATAPLLPPWAPSRRQRSSNSPRPTRSHAHRCSRLTRQHGGEQSGLVTLTFDLESGVRVTYDVGYLCANFGLTSVLDLGLMSYRRQTASSLYWAFTRSDRRTDRSVRPRLCPTVCQTSRTDRLDRL